MVILIFIFGHIHQLNQQVIALLYTAHTVYMNFQTAKTSETAAQQIFCGRYQLSEELHLTLTSLELQRKHCTIRNRDNITELGLFKLYIIFLLLSDLKEWLLDRIYKTFIIHPSRLSCVGNYFKPNCKRANSAHLYPWDQIPPEHELNGSISLHVVSRIKYKVARTAILCSNWNLATCWKLNACWFHP